MRIIAHIKTSDWELGTITWSRQVTLAFQVPFIPDTQLESGQPLCFRGVSLRIPIGGKNHVKLQPIETKDYLLCIKYRGFRNK
jgi:hypothetical protein